MAQASTGLLRKAPWAKSAWPWYNSFMMTVFQKGKDMLTTGVSTIDVSRSVAREFVLPIDQVTRLQRLAETQKMSESRVVEKALDILFGLAEIFDQDLDRQALYRLSEPSLLRVWDNDPDAAYDSWRELYDVSEG
jgi:hypothetical protein